MEPKTKLSIDCIGLILWIWQMGINFKEIKSKILISNTVTILQCSRS
jgi:hypothetical protein